MALALASLPALAAIAPLDIAPASDKDAGYVAQDIVMHAAESGSHMDKLSMQLSQIDEIYASGKPISAALGDLSALVASLPAHSALRARLMAYVADLEQRALAAYISAQEMSALRREFVAARLDRALDALRDRALAGGWSRPDVERVAIHLIGRAEMFVDAPDPAAYRARVMAAIESALLSTSDTVSMMRELRIQLLLGRLEIVEGELIALVKDGVISASEFDALYAHQVQRARQVYMAWASA